MLMISLSELKEFTTNMNEDSSVQTIVKKAEEVLHSVGDDKVSDLNFFTMHTATAFLSYMHETREPNNVTNQQSVAGSLLGRTVPTYQDRNRFVNKLKAESPCKRCG
eukprot:gb/GEZJ01011344.1/.p1 GENE.gb/GEZJ01011344.1/~~gb/GEZJ01011344.1/.p1  ORF type:complete len:107 (+),score=13.47 gb/GEZJ01011344.1/:102-422(+)